jgi:hypothetical protein
MAGELIAVVQHYKALGGCWPATAGMKKQPEKSFGFIVQNQDLEQVKRIKSAQVGRLGPGHSALITPSTSPPVKCNSPLKSCNPSQIC